MKKLLIVDDDLQTRRLLTILFENDYQVFKAADGIMALKMVLEHQPDVVLLDGCLPRLDGLTVLRAIKSEPELANILVVMLTGRGQFSDLENGIDSGADAYFIKPFDQKKLQVWVETNLKLRENSVLNLACQVENDEKVETPTVH
ncbi:MAG: response regulator [Polaromonas sp.]|nr:response regulator [Polaromonas sp.]